MVMVSVVRCSCGHNVLCVDANAGFASHKALSRTRPKAPRRRAFLLCVVFAGMQVNARGYWEMVGNCYVMSFFLMGGLDSVDGVMV